MEVIIESEATKRILSPHDINEKLEGLTSGQVFQVKAYQRNRIVTCQYLILNKSYGNITPILCLTTGEVLKVSGTNKFKSLRLDEIFEVGIFDGRHIELNDFKRLGGQ